MADENKESLSYVARLAVNLTAHEFLFVSSDVVSGKQGEVKRSRLTLSDANKDQSVRKVCLRAKIAFKIKRYATGALILARVRFYRALIFYVEK